MNENSINENNFDTVTLFLDNDSVVECAVLCILPVEEQQYVALLPLNDEEEEEESQIYLYRYVEHGDDEPELHNIEDDREFETAANAYNEWLDSLEYEDMDLDALE